MPHWDLIRSGSDSPAPRSNRQWDRAITDLRLHGLGGYVFSRAKDHLPSRARAELEKDWRSQWHRNLILEETLRDLLENASRRGLGTVVLKGMALLGDIYPDLGARSISDIDLLVSAGEWEEFSGLVRTIGFREIDCPRWSANEFKCNFSRDVHGTEVALELHQRLFFTESRLSGTSPWQTESLSSAFRRLTPSDMLVHLMGHLAHQHTFLFLSWLVDIDLFIRRHGNEIDWGRVRSLSRSLRLERSAAAVCVALQHLKTPLHGTGISPKSSRLLTEDFLWEPTRRKFSYYLLKHRLKDSWKEAFAYDLGWAQNRLFG